MKLLLLSLCIICAMCGHRDPKPKEPVRIVVDLSKPYQGLDGGIMWQHGEPDTANGRFGFKPLDTIFGIKNWPVVIVITDGDTTFHYGNDTIRIPTCNIDTVIRYINNARDVYINN